MALIDDEKWEAVVNCNKIYDGQFLYGVKTTASFADHHVNQEFL